MDEKIDANKLIENLANKLSDATLKIAMLEVRLQDAYEKASEVTNTVQVTEADVS